ncbi:GFA family protein [Aestuariivirga sp.]|uniref:GFA family protein n=1 Tax=Aestuariivirga sp. TaxID=2650926 RepID=UPI003017E3E9
MTKQDGGCLCRKVRYAALNEPEMVAVCHCRFCQRATGSAYMVEPIFNKDDFTLLSGTPRIYDQRSAGSGKIVHIHFCADCGTKLWLSFERFQDVVGVYAGTFDDPCWFSILPQSSKHIFLGVARHDTVIPAGLPTFIEHAMSNDGTPQPATVFEQHQQMGSP